MELIKQIDETVSFNEKNIRVIGSYNEPWFVAKDICNILELKNITETMKMIPEKWRGSEKLNTFGGEQNMIIISEAGLYKLIMRSNKPVAQKFQEYVCEEILPSIRKTGQYKLDELYKQIEEKNEEFKNSQQVLATKDKQIETLQIDLEQEQKDVIKTKKSLMQTQSRFSQRYKFPENSCVYILQDPDCKYNKLKIGLTTNINTRLASDRTMIPCVKVRFIMYTEHC